MATEKKIISEIVEKADEFELGMARFMGQVGEWTELFKATPPKRTERAFSNPRQTEFFRAASATGTLMYRMMTADDPYFSVYPADLNANDDQLDTLTHTWNTQLRIAKHRQNLLRACHFIPTFGTVICQEDYRIVGVSAFGRQVPVTVMMPRVLDQVMFDRATVNIDEADWLATADITSKVALMRLAYEAKELKAPWNAKALEAAANAVEEKNTINWRVLERIRRAGFTADEALSKKKELLMYYGKFDCMNDGIEYVAALINRKYLVRFHANNFQHGRRPFRVAKWVDFTDSLGLGYGHILGNQHKSMDANRQKAQDLFSFGAYNMWLRRPNTSADEDLVIKPLNVIDGEPGDLTPITPNLGAGEGILKLDELLKQEFRAAAHASDTLQAIVTDATATASSLAQNEAMRAVSVKAEMVGESLVREHLENLHANNVQNIRAPFNINRAGVAKRVYPIELRIDVDIAAKTTTDKDFQPKRLEKLINLIQILTSTKSDHPDQMAISILPLVKEVARMLQVNPNDVIMKPGAAPTPMGMGSADLSGLAAAMAPGAGAAGAGGPPGPVNTPVGPVLAS